MNVSTARVISKVSPGSPGTLRTRAIDLVVWVSWHVLSAVCLPLAVSKFRLDVPLWSMWFDARAFLAGLLMTHLMAATILSWLARKRGVVGLVGVAASVVPPYAALVIALELTGYWYSRSMLVMAVAASFVLAAVSFELMPRLYRVLLPALLIATVFVVQMSFSGWPADQSIVRQTTFYPVRLVSSTGVSIPSEVFGGAIDVLGTGLLVVSGDGALQYVEAGGATGYRSRRLPYDVPLYRDAYLADGPDNTFPNDPFRVSDVLVEEFDDRLRLFASHHYWDRQRRCIGLRVSMVEASREAFLDGRAEAGWKTVFSSQPCLPLGEIRFEQTGGSMIRLDARTLLLTIGDHNLDGFYAKASVAQDPTSQYGKTIRIDLESGASDVYTLGHRNPHGLTRTPDGRLWVTEQGPNGGDELNLITAGANYGWPLVTYGAAYDKRTWPPSARDGYHSGFTEPFFAWVPSIAVNSVLTIQRDLFPLWKGDLLVASLKGFVFRLRVDRQRVLFVETVHETKTRIRDMAEAPDGRIFLYQDDGAISFLEPQPVPPEPDIEVVGARPDRGAALFVACQDCHRFGSGADHGAGPDLRGTIGRRIASAPGFDYSPALKALGGAWTEESLDRFLEDPEKFAPGTSMKTEGISNAATRQLLIEYLAGRSK